MIVWMVLGVYVLGWLLAVRPALRARMLAEACPKCKATFAGSSAHEWCRRYVGSTSRYEFIPLAPRGSYRDRNGTDAFVAVLLAASWPVYLLFMAVVWLVDATGRGILKAAPLTGPELERRIREQEAEIARLSEQIEADHG